MAIRRKCEKHRDAPFEVTRPKKRYCSPRCQVRAEKQRAKKRKADARYLTNVVTVSFNCAKCAKLCVPKRTGRPLTPPLCGACHIKRRNAARYRRANAHGQALH